MSDKFDRILQIFQELSGVKTAADATPRIESKVTEHKPGAHDKQTSRLLQEMYPTAIDVGESHPNTKQDASAANTDVRFPLEGESDVTKQIKNLDLNPENYKLASYDDDSLRDLFVNVSSDLINEISHYGQSVSVQQPAVAQQPKTAAASQTPQDIASIIAQNLTENDVEAFATGILYGIQKQAEMDAEEVGQYLISYLHQSLNQLKQAADAAADDTDSEESEEEEDDEAEKEEPKPGEEPKEPEEELKSREDEANKKLEDKKKEEDKDQLSEDQAAQVLADMQGKTSDEDVLQNLGLALTELGITPEELAKTGSAGAKLASDFNNFRRKGKFRLEPVPQSKRAAVDRIKGYVLELLERSR